MGKWELVRLGDVCEGKSSNIAQKDLEQNEGEYPIYGASGLIKHVDFYRHDSEYIAVIKDGAGIGRTTLCPAKSSVIGTMQAILPKPSVNSRYLYYVISGMNLASYYTGATIPHIYFKDYSKEMLALPPLQIQQQIVDVLDRANALIEKRKAQIEKLDLLVKSQFIEMFGDYSLENIQWEVATLGERADIASGVTKGRKISAETIETPYLRVANVKDGYMELSEIKNIPATKIEIERYALQPGDVLMTEGGDPDKLGRGAIWHGQISPCIHQNHIFRVRLNTAFINPVYFAYCLLQPFTKRYFLRSAKQTTGIASINMTQLTRLPVYVPPLAMQNQFAGFVHQMESQKTLLQKSLFKLELNYKSLMQKCFRGEVF